MRCCLSCFAGCSAFCKQPDGVSNSIGLLFGAGWGPDYGDPLTCIHCFDIRGGDMLNCSGINYESQGQDDEQKAVLKAIGPEDIQKEYARYEEKIVRSEVFRRLPSDSASRRTPLTLAVTFPLPGGLGTFTL